MTSKLIQRRPFIVLVMSTLIILLAGAFTLALQMQQRQGTRADGGSVVGPPSLPAANVNTIFARVGSPMVGNGQVVEQAARQANIDDAFALAVWWVETNDGAAGVGRADSNPGSVRGSMGYPAAYDGYTIYPSYAAAITDWFNVLKSRYISRGLTSVYAICYPYVGTSSAPLWAGKVFALMQRYRGEAPPPPTATPMPTPTRAPIHIESNEPRRDMAMPEVTSAQRSRQSAAQQQTAPAVTLTAAQPVMIGLGALLAVALALLAVRLTGRGAPVSVEVEVKPMATKRSDPITPPLFVNEFSPVIERSTTALLIEDWVAELPLPSMEQSAIEGNGMGVGAVPRAKQPEKGLRRRRMVPYVAESKTEQVAVVTGVAEEQERETGMLVYRPGGIGLRGRVPEPAGASSGGLLSRYGNKRQA